MGISANIGLIAIMILLPKLGWSAVFIFFGLLTVISGILILIFNEKPLPKHKHVDDPTPEKTRRKLPFSNN